jgi:hypothetical protein
MNLLISIVLSAAAPSQTPMQAPPPRLVEEPAEPRDPTKPSPKLREAIGTGKNADLALPALPSLILKGRVLANDRPAGAFIEIGNHLQLVSVGAKILVGDRQTLHIVAITRDEVRIEVEPNKHVISLR